MNKEAFIAQYGEVAYAKILAKRNARKKAWYEEHPEALVEKNRRNAAWMKKWRDEHLEEAHRRAVEWKRNNPEKVKKHDREISRKGGRYYEQAKRRGANGIPNEKKKIRSAHGTKYFKYKQIIAPDSHLHHNWRNDGTAGYDGVALVEADQHMHGFIDVIEVLEGKITLFSEKEIKEQEAI